MRTNESTNNPARATTVERQREAERQKELARRKELERQRERAAAARGNQGDSPDESDKVRYSPWLFVPVFPQGVDYWDTLAITVKSPDPLHPDQPVANEDNFVTVLLGNRGAMEAAPVQVDFWWGDPGLGLGAGQMNPIGYVTDVIVSPGELKPVTCPNPWRPPSSATGHKCLMINSSAPLSDPLAPWLRFQPQADRHVGQRNRWVYPGPPGFGWKLSLNVTNLFPLSAQTTVFFQAMKVVASPRTLEHVAPAELPMRVLSAGAFGAGSTEQPHVDDFVAQSWGAPPARTHLSEATGIVRTGAEGRYLANLLLASEYSAPTERWGNRGDVVALHEALMRPYELRTLAVEVEVPEQARVGEFFVYRFSQVAEGLLLGGYTIIVQVEK